MGKREIPEKTQHDEVASDEVASDEVASDDDGREHGAEADQAVGDAIEDLFGW